MLTYQGFCGEYILTAHCDECAEPILDHSTAVAITVWDAISGEFRIVGGPWHFHNACSVAYRTRANSKGGTVDMAPLYRHLNEYAPRPPRLPSQPAT